MITSEVNKIKGTRHSVSVSVDENDIEEATTEFFESIQSNVELKGFRKGKAPINLIRAQYKDNQDVKKRINMGVIGKSYTQIIAEKNLYALTAPNFNEVDSNTGMVGLYGADGALNYTFEIDLRPEIDVTGYLDMDLEKVEDTFDEEFQNRLEIFGRMFAERNVIEDREARSGDDVVISYVGTRDGEEFDSNEKTDPFNLGSNTYIDGFEEGIVGMNIGDTKTITVTFPEEYHNEDLSGKEAQFEIGLQEIHEVVLSEVNDELALGLGHKNKEEFLEATKKEVQKLVDERANQEYELQIVEKLLVDNSCDVPEEWMERRTQELAQQLGKSLEVEEDKQELTEKAAKSLQRGLVVKAIYDKEKLEVTEDDLRKCILADARVRGVNPNELIKAIVEQNMMEQYTQIAEFKKTYEFLFDNSNIGKELAELAEKVKEEPQFVGTPTEHTTLTQEEGNAILEEHKEKTQEEEAKLQDTALDSE
jgi:trigger factor